METETEIFREEDLILSHMDQVGRLDKDRELSRLVNVLNDILIRYSDCESEQVESVYTELKRELTREYSKIQMIDVDRTEMRVWHLSIFSSIKLLQKLLVNKEFENPEEIVNQFKDILTGHFEHQLKFFSEKYDIEDLTERLPETEIILGYGIEVRRWYDKEQQRQESTERTRDPSWKTESKSEPQQIEVSL